MDRGAPYRGIRDQNQCYLCIPVNRHSPAKEQGSDPKAALSGWVAGPCGGTCCRILLVVILQHLITGLAQFGTIFLQAGQHSEIALIDDRAAITLNIARTGGLFLRRSAALRRSPETPASALCASELTSPSLTTTLAATGNRRDLRRK